ncbi:hypothetical protein EPO05_05730 [Patescibacteria group bacterium]|nr:MAG: hypothetical protein EPO05_05730 [Patescibacteria group bacterium]
MTRFSSSRWLDVFWGSTLCFVVVVASVLWSALPVRSADSDDEIKEDIESVEKKLQREEAAKAQLEQELGKIQYSVTNTQREIQKTESLLKDTKDTIARKELELRLMDERMQLQTELLKGLIREVYYEEQLPVESAFFSQQEFSQSILTVDQLSNLNQKIQDIMDDIERSKEKISGEKVALDDQKEEHEKLLALKEDQQQDLLADKRETQGDIAEKAATIEELNAKLSALRSNLSGYLGKAYNAKDISDAASFASKATGVRKDFIMGMLVVESDLGRFTGGCYAKDSRMSGNRLTLFQGICKDLDYDWKKRKVSCPPRGYRGTGGAMGVAQFMSDTWTGYKSSIASKTGHNPPDPWNLTDGVMAMALKLAKVPGVTSHKKTGECNAAKIYLSGTTSSKYDWYCKKVLYWADNYEAKMGG